MLARFSSLKIAIVPGVSATPYEDNLRYFNVVIAGPSDSPYEGTLLRALLCPSLAEHLPLQAVFSSWSFSCQRIIQWHHLKCDF